MTEAEAKLKWCPMARVTVINEAMPDPFNRIAWRSANNDLGLDPAPSACLCIASSCMMWQAHTLLGGVAGGDCGLKS